MFMPGTFGMHDAEQRLYERRHRKQQQRIKEEKARVQSMASKTSKVGASLLASRTVDIDAAASATKKTSTAATAPRQSTKPIVHSTLSQRPAHHVRMPLAVHKQTPRSSPLRVRARSPVAAASTRPSTAPPRAQAQRSTLSPSSEEPARIESATTRRPGAAKSQMSPPPSPLAAATPRPTKTLETVANAHATRVGAAASAKQTDIRQEPSINSSSLLRKSERSETMMSAAGPGASNSRRVKRSPRMKHAPNAAARNGSSPSTVTARDTRAGRATSSPSGGGLSRLSPQTRTLVVSIISGLVTAMAVFLMLALLNPTFVEKAPPLNVDASIVDAPPDYRKVAAFSVVAGLAAGVAPFAWRYVKPYVESWAPWRVAA